MSFGLFGGGNTSNTTQSTTTYATNTEITATPQLDFSGGSAGNSALTLTPSLVGNSNTLTDNLSYQSYYAPITLTPSTNYGDAAINAAQATAQQAVASTSTSGLSWLTSLFSGSNLYWILGALVVIMIARGHHR